MAYITTNQTDNTYYDLYIQGDGHLYANKDSKYLFANLKGVDQINGIDKLNQLKAKLLATDYISNKIAEGAATKEEYTDQIAQRAAWRARINELEELL